MRREPAGQGRRLRRVDASGLRCENGSSALLDLVVQNAPPLRNL